MILMMTNSNIYASWFWHSPAKPLPTSRATLSKPGNIADNWYRVRHQSSFYGEHQEALYPIYIPTHFISTYVTHRSWFLDMSLWSYYKGIVSCLTVPSSESDIAPHVINRSPCAFCPLRLARPPWIQTLVWKFLNGGSLLLTDADYKTLRLKYHSKEDSPNFSAIVSNIFDWNSTMSAK